MDLIRCPECGELYSPSYPRCPFCEEDGENAGKVTHKPKRHLAGKQVGQSARGGLIVVLVLVLALLGWYLFGDNIIHRADNIEKKTETVEPAPGESGQDDVPAINPSTALPDEEPAVDTTEPTAPEQTTVEPAEPVQPAVENVDVSNAKLNRTDFTLSYAGEKFTIKLSGTEATPQWSIDNANVAAISADGTVTAVANGNTTVHCKVGSRDLSCVVRVRNTGKNAAAASAPTTATPVTPETPAKPGTAETTPAATTPTTPATQGTASPNTGTTSGAGADTQHVDASSLTIKTNYGNTLPKDPSSGYPDCTVRIGGDPLSLRVEGTDLKPTWSSDKTSVVTVDEKGKLTPVSPGTAHVTATVGDAKVTCIIRVR